MTSYYIKVKSCVDPILNNEPEYWSQQIVSATQSNLFYNLGNVGIGVPNPLGKLQVDGSCGIGTSYATIAPPTNGLIVSGNVGIGTAAPTKKLSVVGSCLITGTDTGATANALVVNQQGTDPQYIATFLNDGVAAYLFGTSHATFYKSLFVNGTSLTGNIITANSLISTPSISATYANVNILKYMNENGNETYTSTQFYATGLSTTATVIDLSTLTQLLSNTAANYPAANLLITIRGTMSVWQTAGNAYTTRKALAFELTGVFHYDTTTLAFVQAATPTKTQLVTNDATNYLVTNRIVFALSGTPASLVLSFTTHLAGYEGTVSGLISYVCV